MSSRRPNNNGGGGNSPVNYRIIDPGDKQISIIEVKSGLFRGVRFRIGKVGINEIDGEPRLSFTTDIIKKPWWLFFIRLKTNRLFTRVSGDILVDLLQLNAGEYNNILVG